MFNFFNVIFEFLGTIVDYVVETFEIIIYVFTFILQGFAYIGRCLQVLPPWITPFIIASTSYIVIITVLNKGR